MTKHGETDGYKASDFVKAVQRYLGVPWSLDHVIVNDSSALPEHLLRRYALENAHPVEPDLEHCARLGPRPHFHPLAAAGTLLRHDSPILARVVLDLVGQSAESDELRPIFAA